MRSPGGRLPAAGHPAGAGLEPVELIFLPGQGAYVREVKTELTAVGFSVTTKRVTTFDRLVSGRFNLWTLGWGADYPGAENFLYQLFHSDTNGSMCGYAGADAELDAARAMIDDTARLTAWKGCDTKIAADVPVIPIAYGGRTTICSARLHDATLSSMELFDFTSVWIRP